ncbi:PAS domain S-box protein [Arcticibacter sp. MXS-1]|uniref:PAS domain S-box protein n=1 Tax=Arcticibacter sp. MXS-1 TaxID=3341726 RepID=UPI0035A818BA
MDVELLKNLFHNSRYFYIICVDTEGRYTYINEHYLSRFQHIDKKFIGQPFHITMHSEDITVVERTCERCFKQPDRMFPATIKKYGSHGSFIITQWEFKLIQTAGEYQGFFCMGYDVTELELHRQELTEAKKQIGEASKVIEDIAFTQSHLVRRPLSNILGLMSILENLELSDEARGIVEMLKSSSLRLDDIIKEIVKKTNE